LRKKINQLLTKMKKNKIIAVLLMMISSSLAIGSDNSIYIDQAGDNAVITMLQEGAGNRIRGIQGVGTGNTTPAKITGDAVNISVEQVGSGNILNLGLVTTTANGSSPTNVVYKVTGSNAVGTINLNNAGTGVNSSTNLDIDQSGDGAIATVNILGSNNSLTVDQAGGNNNKIVATINANSTTSVINQTGGGGNETTLNLTGDKGTVNLTTVGTLNVTSITQSGGSTSGHSATINLTGSSNSTTLLQQGTLDTTVNIVGVGSGNTFNITTKN
jgi:hypothetical protein